MKKTTIPVCVCMALLSCMLLTNCTRQRNWTYSADPVVRKPPLLDKTVVVLPLEDAREDTNEERLNMWFVPFFPYGWTNLSVPEETSTHVTSLAWSFDPDRDMARAIAQELNSARIFRNVTYAREAKEEDLVLRGVIQSTFYSGERYSYGISVLSFPLWFLGLPYATASNELQITLTLEDPKTEEVLWKHESHRGKDSTSWVYTFRPDFFYEDLLKGTMKLEVIPSLKEKVAGVPPE